jgi:restriction system protein
MVRQPKRQRTPQANNSLLGMAVSLVGVGVVLLLVAALFRSNKTQENAAAVFDRPAVLAIGLGALLLAIHFLTRRGNPGQNTGEQGTPAMRGAPSPHDKLGEATSPIQPTAPASTWSSAVFAAIEWRRFEAVCEALFAQGALEARVQAHGADGGVDIWLHSENAQRPVAVVQCKHWQGKPVGVKELRKFFEMMALHDLKHGTYATTSAYTTDAKAFAQANGINAMDGSDLLTLIDQRTPEQQAALLAVAYKGKYWRPTCASCGIKLVEQKPVEGGALYWGCSNYPRCTTRIYMVANSYI